MFRSALKEPSHADSFKALQVYLLSVFLCSYFSILINPVLLKDCFMYNNYD